MRAVLDTNVLFSAIGWNGTPYRCIQGAFAGRFELITCQAILNELRSKLISKLDFEEKGADEAIAEVILLARVIEVKLVPEVIQEDQTDDVVLACAVESKSDWLVSGDRHLLRLGSYQGIPIVNPAAFMEQFPDHKS